MAKCFSLVLLSFAIWNADGTTSYKERTWSRVGNKKSDSSRQVWCRFWIEFQFDIRMQSTRSSMKSLCIWPSIYPRPSAMTRCCFSRCSSALFNQVVACCCCRVVYLCLADRFGADAPWAVFSWRASSSMEDRNDSVRSIISLCNRIYELNSIESLARSVRSSRPFVGGESAWLYEKPAANQQFFSSIAGVACVLIFTFPTFLVSRRPGHIVDERMWPQPFPE